MKEENYREQCQRWENMPGFHRQPSLPFSLLEVHMTGYTQLDKGPETPGPLPCPSTFVDFPVPQCSHFNTVPRVTLCPLAELVQQGC